MTDKRYHHQNRRKYSLKAHIVLVTKYRRQILTGSVADDVKQKIYNIAILKIGKLSLWKQIKTIYIF